MGDGPPGLTLDKFVARYWPEKRPDVIVSGDSHTELIAEVDGILCVNPGSPTCPQIRPAVRHDRLSRTRRRKADASVWLITDDDIGPFDCDAIPPRKLRQLTCNARQPSAGRTRFALV